MNYTRIAVILLVLGLGLGAAACTALTWPFGAAAVLGQLSGWVLVYAVVFGITADIHNTNSKRPPQGF